GVQSQTRVLMRALRRLRLPTLVFVNKIDRAGARYESLLRELARKLDPAVIALDAVARPGGPNARSLPRSGEAFETELVDLLAEHDDDLLADYLRDERAAAPERLRSSLAAQTGRARVFPVHFGS